MERFPINSYNELDHQEIIRKTKLITFKDIDETSLEMYFINSEDELHHHITTFC